jgi:hypothetical protein
LKSDQSRRAPRQSTEHDETRSETNTNRATGTVRFPTKVGLSGASLETTRRHSLPSRAMERSMEADEPRHCAWCGRRLPGSGRIGRPRRYCAQPCRQRAYERRAALQRGGLPEDAVVLSTAELADLQDRLFQLRCAAEDVVTAAQDGAENEELRKLAAELVESAKGLERLR